MLSTSKSSLTQIDHLPVLPCSQRLLFPTHNSLLITRFVSLTPLYAPTAPGTNDNIFITKSYDATSHFETVVDDVFDVWQRVKGEPLVLKKREVEVEA